MIILPQFLNDILCILPPRQQRQKCLLTLLNLTTKVALTVTTQGMLESPASIATGFTPLLMGLGMSLGKTHDHRVCKRTDYHCSTSPGSIQVIVFIFSQGRHYDKDDRMNGGEIQDLVKSYSEVTKKDF
jgi:hypothetical protein